MLEILSVLDSQSRSSREEFSDISQSVHGVMLVEVVVNQSGAPARTTNCEETCSTPTTPSLLISADPSINPNKTYSAPSCRRWRIREEVEECPAAAGCVKNPRPCRCQSIFDGI